MTDDPARGQKLADAAASFIGVPFRLHGREPKSGLDCIGLIACSLNEIGNSPSIPEGYNLRNADISSWVGCALTSDFVEASGPIEAGDMLLTKPGPGQHHVLIAADELEAIHAHAGLKRVVRQPLASIGAIHSHWRLT